MGGCLFDIASWSASPSIAAVPISPEIDVTCHKANMRLGVHEFLLKPISPKMLQDRLLSILVEPRPMVQIGNITCRSRAAWSPPAR
jgi:response regulator of citrate/malate metabolism